MILFALLGWAVALALFVRNLDNARNFRAARIQRNTALENLKTTDDYVRKLESEHHKIRAMVGASMGESALSAVVRRMGGEAKVYS